MIEFITIISVVLGLPIAGYEIWSRLIRPYIRHTKVLRAAELIGEWYRHLEEASIEGRKTEHSGPFVRLERKIDDFIDDQKVGGFLFKMSPSFMQQYMLSCGVDDSRAIDSEAFESRSHCPPRDFSLDDLWAWQKVDGYLWRSEKGTGDPLLAVTMRMKVLKMYLNIKET